MRINRLILIVFVCMFISGCDQNGYNKSQGSTELQTKTIFAMDTAMQFQIYTSRSDIIDLLENEIKHLDRLFDRGNSESDIYLINNTSAPITVADDTATVINTALEISSQTDGAFDISIAPIMDAWGFYTHDYVIPDTSVIDELIKNVNYHEISLNANTLCTPDNMMLDLGGIAKGFAADKLVKIIEDNDINSGIISLGGNIAAIGSKPDGSQWSVAIQDPFNSDKYIGAVSVADKAVVTSGAYQRYFESGGNIYHHIIDPHTGYPADNDIASVTIISDNGTTADALSTALFVMGMDNAADYYRKHQSFDAVFITKENEIYITPGLKNSFKSENTFSVIE